MIPLFPDWQLPSPSDMDRVTIELPSDATSLLTPVQQVATVLMGIVTTTLTILNTVFAWLGYRRSKLQETLHKLQIAKIEREELTEMKVAEEKARSEVAKTGIISFAGNTGSSLSSALHATEPGCADNHQDTKAGFNTHDKPIYQVDFTRATSLHPVAHYQALRRAFQSLRSNHPPLDGTYESHRSD